MTDQGLSVGMRWSGISIVGREVCRTAFTVLLARMVGPDDFGVVAEAMVFIGIVGYLLDQGFASALIQRRQLEPDMPGAIVSVNLTVGSILAATTVALAPAWAGFMHTAAVAPVLAILATSLLIRAACITPRALLIRAMQFRKLGLADIAGAVSGGIAGLAVAAAGGGYWAIVVQVVGTDVVVLLILLLCGVGHRPNLHLRLIKEIAAFSSRAFAAGVLVNGVTRNIDNVLVGKFQGPQALAFYGLAYRLLLLPVQMASVTVGAVLFPAFSRLADNRDALRVEAIRSVRVLAAIVLPAMALVAAAAPQLVILVFGREWAPAIPIVQVLAVAGAVEAIYQPSTTPLVLGMGRAKLNLKYAAISTSLTIFGITAGLPFGPFAVATGYAAAALILVPVEWQIRRHLLAIGLLRQVKALIPGIHVSVWIAIAYVSIALAIEGRDLFVLLIGVPLALGTGFVVLFVVHRAQYEELSHIAHRVLGRYSGPIRARDSQDVASE